MTSPVPAPTAARSRLHRVRDRETQVALRRSRRVRRGPLTVSSVPEPDPVATPRVAYSVGRSVGGAVVRNRVRRRIRSVMGELAPVLVGRAWLVGASREAADLEYPVLRGHAADAVGAFCP